MAKYAKIEGGAVASVIIADAPFNGHDALVPDGLPVSVGTEYAGGEFVVPVADPPTPQPVPLTKLQFVSLGQTAGGMTDAQLVAARSDSNLAAMWIKLELAEQVDRDNPDTQAAIAALDALGYLPNGAAAVLAAWPVS